MHILEILISLIIASIFIGGSVTASFLGQNSQIFNQQYLQAQYYEQQALDIARTSSNRNFNQSLNTTTNESIYKTSVTERSINQYTKQVTATVSWTKPTGQSITIELTTQLTDWASIMNGTVCILSGNWNRPQILSSMQFSDPVTDIEVIGSTAYVTTDGTVSSSPDLTIINISDSAHPFIISQLNTGPGLSSIEIVGQYAYVGNTSINAQLQVIDLRNPLLPVVASNYKLPGTYNDNTTIPETIAYANNRIYIGTAKSQISELHIINVTNPLSPIEIGNYETNAGIYNLQLRNYRLYIASAANAEFKILDTEDPRRIIESGGFNTSDGRGKSLELLGDYIYFGRTKGSGEELIIYNDRLGLAVLGKYEINSTIFSLLASNELLFMGTNDPIKSVQVWNTANPNQAILTGTINIPGSVHSLQCGMGKLYALAQTPNALFIIGK